jgi:DnaJ-class molecular chaperone
MDGMIRIESGYGVELYVRLDLANKVKACPRCLGNGRFWHQTFLTNGQLYPYVIWGSVCPECGGNGIKHLTTAST